MKNGESQLDIDISVHSRSLENESILRDGK